MPCISIISIFYICVVVAIRNALLLMDIAKSEKEIFKSSTLLVFEIDFSALHTNKGGNLTISYIIMVSTMETLCVTNAG